MGPVQISHPSVEFKNQLRDGVAPIEACAFHAPRREFIAVDASALRVWGLQRVIKTIMAPNEVRYTECGVKHRSGGRQCTIHAIHDAQGLADHKHERSGICCGAQCSTKVEVATTEMSRTFTTCIRPCIFRASRTPYVAVQHVNN